jgi:hypothetical protein
MCKTNNLRLYVTLHPDSGSFEWLVAQQLDDDCSILEHEGLSSYSNGPSELADWLTSWARQTMAEPSRCS